MIKKYIYKFYGNRKDNYIDEKNKIHNINNLFYTSEKANLSINCLIIMLFIISIIMVSTSIYAQNFSFYKEEEKLIYVDYKSKLIIKVAQINAFYALEQILKENKDSIYFIKECSDKNGEFINSIINKKFYNHDNIIYGISRTEDGLYRIIKEKNYIDIYMDSFLKEGKYIRNKSFVIRVINPYEISQEGTTSKQSIYDQYKIEFTNNMDSNKIKTLIKILEV
ncbi:hypothetical protein [Peptostreptococcus equinus]|uniref:Uncharacterized protein n=1 Tax=Peptostreptococcus equinus TaxID=3003601 RepID=A0ABY7JR88_9FIRM|nr:hypothetical protein [Peptostreptococcus sp. CBA3647]WAW15635.1 hypothetical protein O0R46_04090 [Peptostreptococcus sp. CBA3647]